MPFEQILEQLDLYTGPSERRCLKNVAAMMFCETPHRHFPYTQVDIVVFPEGVEQNPNNMFEVPRIVGTVPAMIRATLDYLRTNVIKERILKVKDAAESIKFFNYPYQALEEAVVNALYHRDYQQREPVEIRIEPHAITILSYAGPDRSITAVALKEAKQLKARRYRNRRLGDFLKELKLSEGRATGIPTIQDELKRNGSSPATIETDDDRSFFLITIPCHPNFLNDTVNTIDDTVNTIDDTVNTINDTVKRQPMIRQTAVLTLMNATPTISAREMADKLKVSYSTIRRDINLLVQEGKVRREGADKTGKWIVCICPHRKNEFIEEKNHRTSPHPFSLGRMRPPCGERDTGHATQDHERQKDIGMAAPISVRPSRCFFCGKGRKRRAAA